MPFWKLLDHYCVQSCFSTITRHIDNSILKDTIQLKILWTWTNIRANSFIQNLVNIMKRKSTNLPWKLFLPPPKKKRRKIRLRTSISRKYVSYIFLVFISFVFSQTTLVSKFKPVLTDMLVVFATVYLWLIINILRSTSMLFFHETFLAVNGENSSWC